MILNKNRKIGQVLFIVEGEKTEPYILRQIFTKIFDYNYTRIYRGNKKDYDKFSSTSDRNSKIFVINAEESNIIHISDKNAYLDNLFTTLINNYDIDFDNSAIFYLWDRDWHSNTNAELIKDLLSSLGNSRDSFDFNRQGLLLLSYPSIEAYTASAFLDNSFDLMLETGTQLKGYLHSQGVNQQKLDEGKIIHAAQELWKALEIMGVLEELNLDDMRNVSTKVLEKQDSLFNERRLYRLLSMMTIALADLGLMSLEK